MATDSSVPEKRTITGSCHCKAISYEAQIPKTFDTLSKCNCTVCQKPGFITVGLPADGSDFKLLTPSSASDVKYYQFRSKDCYRYFCDKCGIQVWGQGKYNFNGNEFQFFSINLNTVDQPQDGFDVSTLKVSYVDGLNDNWMKGTQKEPFPGGVP